MKFSMNQGLIIATLTGFGGMIGWGMSDFLAKKAVDRVGNYATLFWSQFVGLAPLAILLFFSNEQLVIRGGDVFTVGLLSILDAVSWIFLYRAFEKGRVGLLSSVFSATFALAVVLSAFVFGEQISVLGWLALGVIFIGIVLASVDFKTLGRDRNGKAKGIPEVLMAVFLYAFFVAIWGHFIQGRSWVFYMLLVRTLVCVLVFCFSRIKQRSLSIPTRSHWRSLILIGLFDVFAYIVTAIGFSQTTFVSVIAILSGASPIIVVLLGRAFLAERLEKLQIAACIFIVGGVAILSLN